MWATAVVVACLVPSFGSIQAVFLLSETKQVVDEVCCMYGAGDSAVSSERLPQMDPAYTGAKGYDPMHELMRAIILRAIDDYNSKGELHQEAVDYLFDEEEEYIFSFRAICKHLGMDPEKTRYMIMNPVRRISTRRRAA